MKRCILVVMVILVFGAVRPNAQEPFHGPDGGTSFRVSGVELLAVSGVPFFGKSNIEWTRTLQDGSTITSHVQASLARDSQGRMYRERRPLTPIDAEPSQRIDWIVIFDTVEHTRTECDSRTKQCVVSNFVPRVRYQMKPVGPFANNTRYLARESLGTDLLDGFNVIGTRETETVNPGVVGNEHPLASTREFWYNADLQTNIRVIRNEPAIGRQVITLSNVSIGEPDPELFKVPAGYVVHDQRAITRVQ